MGIQAFEDWAEKEHLIKHGQLSLLKGSVIGIDANYFAKQYLGEPLLTALGGSPIALEGISNAVNNLKRAGISLHFVFDGLQPKSNDDPFASTDFTSRHNDAAFSQYENQQPELARRAFQNLAPANLTEHMGTLRLALHEANIPYTVAPYSALAQLVYLEKHPSQFIDAIYGPPELFCFGTDKIITEFTDFLPRDHAEKSEITDASIPLDKVHFAWIDRSACMRNLGNITFELFVEALLLIGSDHFLSTFPPLLDNNIYNKLTMFRDAVGLLVSARGSVASLCDQYPDPTLKDFWLEKYKKAMTIIQFHVIVTAEGDLECLSKEKAPRDVHDCMGLRLPEELYTYLMQGLISVRVLNALSRGEIIVPTPLAGGEFEVCQSFEKNELYPIRKEAICLLTDQVHRYFQRAEYKTYFWFNRTLVERFKPIDTAASKPSTTIWTVRSATIAESKPSAMPPGSLLFAMSSLQDAAFRSKTLEKGTKSEGIFTTQHEVTTNVIWRFLQSRGFIDAAHESTAWGKVLIKALALANGKQCYEEPIFLAIELLRSGLLNADELFQAYSGAPTRGNDEDKAFCLLISRVSSLGKLGHKSKGYSGPLSRSLLAFHYLSSSLQIALRDLIEMGLVSTLLQGWTDRFRSGWMDIARSLPFYEVPSCSLGIAVLTYLDHLEINGDPKDKETQRRTKEQAQGWIQHSDFEDSLQFAFGIWDAVYAGVKEAGDKVKGKRRWDEADAWLQQRR